MHASATDRLHLKVNSFRTCTQTHFENCYLPGASERNIASRQRRRRRRTTNYSIIKKMSENFNLNVLNADLVPLPPPPPRRPARLLYHGEAITAHNNFPRIIFSLYMRHRTLTATVAVGMRGLKIFGGGHNLLVLFIVTHLYAFI